MVIEKEAVTIRFPSELMRQAKRLKSGKESFNELVVEAVEREVRRRKARLSSRYHPAITPNRSNGEREYTPTRSRCSVN